MFRVHGPQYEYSGFTLHISQSSPLPCQRLGSDTSTPYLDHCLDRNCDRQTSNPLRRSLTTLLQSNGQRQISRSQSPASLDAATWLPSFIIDLFPNKNASLVFGRLTTYPRYLRCFDAPQNMDRSPDTNLPTSTGTRTPTRALSKRIHTNGNVISGADRAGSEPIDPAALSKALKDFEDARRTRDRTPGASPSRKRQRIYGDRSVQPVKPGTCQFSVAREALSRYSLPVCEARCRRFQGIVIYIISK